MGVPTIWCRVKTLHTRLNKFPPDDAEKIQIKGGNGSQWRVEWRYWDDAKRVYFVSESDAKAGMVLASRYNHIMRKCLVKKDMVSQTQII